VRTALVVCEIALAVVLMIGASLMMASFVRLFRVDPGFRTEDIVTLQFDLPRASYPEGEQKAAFYDRLLERLKAVPGVTGVGMTNHLPLGGSDTTWTFYAEGRPPAEPGSEPEAGYRVVDSDYFRTMGIPLRRGRGFDSRDHQKDAAAVIVNREMAERFWPGTDPLGKRFKLGDAAAEQPWLTIVGVVGDVKHTGLADRTEPEMFLPYSPAWFDPMTVVVRAKGDPLAVMAPVRRAVRELDPNLPLYNVRPLAQVLSDSLARPRLNLVLMSAFALLALVLAAVGIYSVMAQAVVQQKQRIAIQMALGATQRNVLGLVLRQGMTLALTGLVIGLAAAAGFSRLLSGLLFEVGTTDVATFLQVAVLFTLVSLMAIYIPAFRAARVDPMVFLKA
jgi:putative ABC transport system permease protein